jgi:hypothetical protein
MKTLIILSIVFGECLIVFSEMVATKKVSDGILTYKNVFILAMIVNVLACVILTFGYINGYRMFNNIWIITAVSIAGIVVCEPLVAWFLFKEIPTTGAGIGLSLGLAGILVTFIVK